MLIVCVMYLPHSSKLIAADPALYVYLRKSSPLAPEIGPGIYEAIPSIRLSGNNGKYPLLTIAFLAICTNAGFNVLNDNPLT